MTTKQRLHYECIKVNNEYFALTGKSEDIINLESYSQTYQFEAYARSRKIAELQKELDIAKAALKGAKELARREAWFKTEQGQAYAKEHNEAMERLRSELRTILNEMEKSAKMVVKTLLGKKWDVILFSDDYMEIGIVKEYREDGKPIGRFGHDFTVYYDNRWSKEREWAMSYGTTGQFSLNGEDNDRIEYLIGMAKFASDKKQVPALRDYLYEAKAKCEKIKEEFRKLEKELKSPVIPE